MGWGAWGFHEHRQHLGLPQIAAVRYGDPCDSACDNSTSTAQTGAWGLCSHWKQKQTFCWAPVNMKICFSHLGPRSPQTLPRGPGVPSQELWVVGQARPSSAPMHLASSPDSLGETLRPHSPHRSLRMPDSLWVLRVQDGAQQVLGP